MFMQVTRAIVMLVSDLEAPGGRDADLAYLRVVEDIAARIASGELAQGARLRAERDLAKPYRMRLSQIPAIRSSLLQIVETPHYIAARLRTSSLKI